MGIDVKRSIEIIPFAQVGKERLSAKRRWFEQLDKWQRFPPRTLDSCSNAMCGIAERIRLVVNTLSKNDKVGDHPNVAKEFETKRFSRALEDRTGAFWALPVVELQVKSKT